MDTRCILHFTVSIRSTNVKWTCLPSLENYCGLRKNRVSLTLYAHRLCLITACLPPFPAGILRCIFSFFLSLSFFILGPPSGPSSTVFMRVMWGEITGGLITCWSCGSRSRGNASTTIKRLKKRIVLTTDTLVRCKHLRDFLIPSCIIS